MTLTPEVKAEIDAMPLVAMLRRWRFSLAGDPMFQGEVGAYFSKVMAEKRNADNDEWVAASKSVGWDR